MEECFKGQRINNLNTVVIKKNMIFFLQFMERLDISARTHSTLSVKILTNSVNLIT